jgi:sugar phosphate isomerase/epimerase
MLNSQTPALPARSSTSRNGRRVPLSLSRRDFLGTAALACAGAGFCMTRPAAAAPSNLASCPIAVFSKICQELKLTFEEAAALSAEAGLDGIDCPVRSGGEILPERARDELPKYAEVLRRNKQRLLLLTTGITEPTSPHAEEILEISAKLGVRFYRLGFYKPRKDIPFAQYAREIRARLKDLAALSKQHGITGLFQNHSGSLGADLDEMRLLLEGFDPAEMGLAFDLGHALLAHGSEWRSHFERLKSHLQVAYIKDAKVGSGWVPFGEGEMAGTGYFKMLKDLGYQAPFSLHIEFDWSNKGAAKNRASLLNALKQSTAALRGWVAAA